MKKIYVLDTNIILHDPNAIYSFGENEVVIPTVVLTEIDSKKKLMDELGRNARFFSRQVDELRKLGKLNIGVPLPNGGTLRTVIHDKNSSVFESFDEVNNDNAIIAVAKTLTETSPDTEVIMVSKDVIVRVKSDTIDVIAEDYQHDKVGESEDDLYKGYTEIFVENELIDKFYKDKYIDCDEEALKLFDNHFVVLKSIEIENKRAISRKIGNKLVALSHYKKDMSVFGAKHKNLEQQMALELLLDDSVELVTISGKAGTGKTLLALASALHKTLDEQQYTKVLVARPVVPMGKDLGYLPGEISDKLRPWMQPIYDNLEFLFDCKDDKELSKTLEGYEDILKVEALTYIRGRSIPRQYMIIDEAQNLSQHEVKTIATRMGVGSKLVLVGDPFQIDNPYLDMYSNGLTYVTEKMKDLANVGHATLTKGERSELAQLCADRL